MAYTKVKAALFTLTTKLEAAPKILDPFLPTVKLLDARLFPLSINVTLPDSTERVVIVEDATARTTNNYTLTFKTASGTGVALPPGSKSLLYSDGTNINKGIINKGYYTVPAAYTAVDGDQLLIDTSGGGISSSVTVTLPASPAIGNEVHFIDSGNNLLF